MQCIVPFRTPAGNRAVYGIIKQANRILKKKDFIIDAPQRNREINRYGLLFHQPERQDNSVRIKAQPESA